jgi:hypothetical protein
VPSAHRISRSGVAPKLSAVGQADSLATISGGIVVAMRSRSLPHVIPSSFIWLERGRLARAEVALPPRPRFSGLRT